MAMAFGKVYTFGPTFRAEKSYTQRHAAEFWMIEPEIAFADLQDDMQLAEDMMKFVIRYVMDTCPQDIAFFNQFVDKGLVDRLNNVVNSDFARVTYTEAVELLKKNNENFEYKVDWGTDLQTEHEKYLTEQVFGKPVFVTDYPKEIKAFYMRLNDDGKTVAAADCLVPGIGEIIGGSQREERLEILESRIRELILRRYPDYEGNPAREVLITFLIQGSFHAYLKHAGSGRDGDRDNGQETVRFIASLVKRLQPFPSLPDENTLHKF